MWAIVFRLILLHGPGGQMIDLNPDDIVTLRVPRSDEGHMRDGVKCIVTTIDGKFSAVIETCAEVREMAKEPNKNGKPQ
jgi:hypothetical protein